MSRIAVLLLCLNALVQTSPAKEVNAVTLTASPTMYQDVLTREVTVNCSLPRANSSSFANVISLIMSKVVNPADDNNFVEIASVTEYSHDHPDVRNVTHGAHATGHVAPNTDAFLSMKWVSPNSSVSGRYKCEAFGVDRLGHPQTSTADIVIVEQPVDLTAALNKVKELYNITDSQQREQALFQKLTNGCQSSFKLSPFRQGEYYLISGPSSISSTDGQNLCKSFGGFLAEINDRGEYDFIRKFVVDQLGTQDIWLMLGASDKQREGNWIYANSGKPVTFVDWGNSFSGTSSYNCMFLHLQNGRYQMEDGNCSASKRYAICEIAV